MSLFPQSIKAGIDYSQAQKPIEDIFSSKAFNGDG